MNKLVSKQINSDDYYRKIASSYQELSDKRTKYLTAIEGLVVKYAPSSVGHYLDAGAGDGRRALRIVGAVRAGETTLLDSCAEMLPEPDYTQGISTLCMPITELDEPNKYDLITCLWNVFGHIPSWNERRDALIAMRGALSPKGRLMIDVNNRYNLEYGTTNVIKNFLIGLARPSRRGRFDLQSNSTTHAVHITSHLEMLRLIRQANLSIVAQHVVSYSSGALKKHPWQGQLFYVLSR